MTRRLVAVLSPGFWCTLVAANEGPEDTAAVVMAVTVEYPE
jgi:hypothetical protein